MKIKPLKWTTYTLGDQGAAVEIAAGPFNEYYTIDKLGDQFYFRAQLRRGDLSNTRFDTLEEAKRAAQEDYERYIMSFFED